MSSWLAFAFDHDPAWLGLGPKATAIATEPFGDLPGSDDPVAALCATFVFDNVIAGLDSSGLGPCRVTGWSRQAADDDQRSTLALKFHLDSGETEAATLMLASTTVTRLARAVEARPFKTSSRQSFSVSVQIDLGSLRLRKSTLNRLESGNAVLLGRTYASRNAFMLRFGGHVVAGNLTHQGLEIMSDFEERPRQRDDSAPRDRADPEINVDVVLTRHRMTLAELSALAPGAIVELPPTIGEHIILMVEGQPVGSGRLINVAGALAVQMTGKPDDVG